MRKHSALTITTLKKRSDFLRLNRGRKLVSPFFILRYGPSAISAANTARVGYTVTTKCGNAVVRNRIKRRLRALVRELFPDHAVAGMDYVWIAIAQANPSAAEAPIDALRTAMKQALTTAQRA